jgi:cytosine/adenosine deaminase-related metal-dependent hydrolase
MFFRVLSFATHPRVRNGRHLNRIGLQYVRVHYEREKVVKTVPIFATLAIIFASPALTADCDVAILNGRVMDPETNFDSVRNVCIDGDRIASITKEAITGTEEIDASGHVVAPGFINTHNHSYAPFEQAMMARDGTTSLLDIEVGVSNAAIFYDRYENASLLNYGVGISHEEVRRVVLDGMSGEETSDPTYVLQSRAKVEDMAAAKGGTSKWAVQVPSAEQHKDILRMYEQGMRDGAISVNSTVGYMGFGVTTYEMFDLQKLAKKYDRIFGAHTRFGPTESLPTDYSIGVREVIANMVVLDGAAVMSHMQNSGWSETYEICGRLQEKNYTIFCEYYPSVFGNPNIATPQLMTPELRKANNMDPTTTVFNPLTGKPFESEEQFIQMQKDDPGMGVFVLVRDEEWINQWPHMKDTAIANDVITFFDENGEVLPEDADPEIYGGHPRNARSYSYVFRLAREQGIPLMDIVHNASYTPAKYLSRLGLKSMQERGRMQEGMIADITIFDPATIHDRADMVIGNRSTAPDGIPHVLVSGSFVVRDGQSQIGVRPGKPIRYAPITDGEIVLDYNDKVYQWHANLPDYQDPNRD